MRTLTLLSTGRRSHLRNQSLKELRSSSPSVSLPSLFVRVFYTEIWQAAKGVSASHDALLDLFWRMDNFFKRFKVYSQSFVSTELAEVLVNVVVKVLNILSIATKEVEQSRASESFRRFWGICLSIDRSRNLF